MARHRLTRLEQLKGLRKAVRSPRTPSWLKPSIRRYLRKIEEELRHAGKRDERTLLQIRGKSTVPC
jgi:hypothetical protein